MAIYFQEEFDAIAFSLGTRPRITWLEIFAGRVYVPYRSATIAEQFSSLTRCRSRYLTVMFRFCNKTIVVRSAILQLGRAKEAAFSLIST
jgi:hypothetical protein